MAKTSIFESTQVVFNIEFLSLIPEAINQSSFLIELAEQMELTLCEQIDSGCPVFLGLWDNVLKAEKKLEELLQSWKEEGHLNKGSKVGLTNEDPMLPIDESGEVEELAPDTQNSVLESCLVESSLILPSIDPKVSTDPPSHPQVYYVCKDVNQSQSPQITYCTLIRNCSSTQLNNPTDEEKKKSSLLKNNETETGVKDIYVDISVNPVKTKLTKKQSSIESAKEKSSEEQHPLYKLCQLLRIEEETNTDKRLSKCEKSRNSESQLPYKYFCDQCSFKAKRKNHIIKHAKLHEKIKELFCCNQCDFKTIRESVLCRHKMHHSKTKLLCKLCSYETDSRHFLFKHYRVRHAPNIKEKLKCNSCDYVAPTVREIRRHRNLFHKTEKSPKIWKCLKCPYKSKLRAHVTRHENDVHGSVRQFLCHYCGKFFKRNDTLTQHKVIHGEVSKTFTCGTCGKVCTSSVFLREHLASHTTERPFVCDVCGRSFKTRSATQRHKRTMHPANNSLLSCTECGCIFKSRPDLNRHKKIHRCKTQSSVVSSGSKVQGDVMATPITFKIYTNQMQTNK